MTRVFPCAQAGWVVCLSVMCLLMTGCGSIHIGTNTHTHVFGSSVTQTDDAMTGQVNQSLKVIKQMQDPDAKLEPLEDFKWTEAGLPEEELTEDQLRQIKRGGK